MKAIERLSRSTDCPLPRWESRQAPSGPYKTGNLFRKRHWGRRRAKTEDGALVVIVVMPAEGREEAATTTGEGKACAKSIEARDKRERRVAAWCEVKKRAPKAAACKVVEVQRACMTPVVE